MSGKRWGFYFAGVCILATALTTAPAVAQAPAPSGCNIAGSAGATASVVQATGESLQRKRWQPHGGVIQFTLRSFVAVPDKASFFVCFRWKTNGGTGVFTERRPDRLDRNNDGTTWTVTTTVPVQLEPAPADSIVNSALPLVPLAEVRIVALKEDKTLAADAVTTIGITYPWVAFLFAAATIGIALVALIIIAHLRLEHAGIRKANWALRIISTPSGYASLSQLQIVLWTLVVAASAVYVMSLSGDLIEISNGTLVLLGIAGVAALGAKAHSESQGAAAQSTSATELQKANQAKVTAAAKADVADAVASIAATADKNVADKAASDAKAVAEAAKTRADAFKNPPPDQTPRWSDLIINETTTADGTITREIDVARFQMLLFTLITAVFVLMNVLTTYAIPEIPTGFLTLMGISNGVYLGAKVVQGS
jgi:hypothetical protein